MEKPEANAILPDAAVLPEVAAHEAPKRSFSIVGSHRTKSVVEHVMEAVFVTCGLIAVAAVLLITVYMFISGAPAILKIGVLDFLFGHVWGPTDGHFGILYMIFSSIVGTFGAILVGVPIGVLTAVFMSELAPKALRNIVRPAVELLAGIPSVIYGLIGSILIVPVFSMFEEMLFIDSPSHKFTGGANLLSAIVVLAIMILPTIINVSEMALRAVPAEYKEASLAVGATHIQTVFKVLIPAARSGIVTAIVLGIGRAIGEAMAIMLVAGNVVNLPLPFSSVRFLTTGIVSEFAYSSGLHRQALFGIGLVLFFFIMIINFILNTLLKSGGKDNG